ncbi:MAG: hypothetical protein FRX48_08264 [Lasallia pustulata]|uniref:Transcription factor SipA3 n=1 Tax=Lasallia pustulata TaxID=136370 RepID=A0A5M8PFN0_9LECA|nr:MAG: hypothetical protein FRX48_08264 [Lasallia pustulata]
MAEAIQPALTQITKPISLVPVGLKEAALDSPTFRATTLHFSEQVDIVEKWLDGYVKSITKLSYELSTFESLVNAFIAYGAPPAQVSEAVLDHDYTLLAIKRYGEGAREYWSSTISGLKRLDASVVDPIRNFLQTDIRAFKESRRHLEIMQKQIDNLQARYAAQTKTKEASSLREDAFQLHEARKAYLKASMDFCVIAPNLRTSLDKLLVKLFSDQWRDMRASRDHVNSSLGKWGTEIERIRGWSREMESGERTFRRELQAARKQIEESAEAAARPSRELEDYSVSAASLGSKGSTKSGAQTSAKPGLLKSEKQGWLYLRTLTGKPTRTVWVRRWYFVKNGIFGWLVQGSRSGGVEESERIGVLLCNVRPAPQEERRFCFEVMTKDTTILLQADTQPELADWISGFDVAKRKALEDPESTDSPGGARSQDAAFAISPPIAPEFAASSGDVGMQQLTDEALGIERSGTLLIPGDPLTTRSSIDVSMHRRPTIGEREGENPREHAARIIQKLDLHRKSNAGVAGSLPNSPGLAPGGPSGGIASLIAASHNVLPVGPATLPPPSESSAGRIMPSTLRDLPTSTLAPSTLANPPAPTNLSDAAVIVNGERGIGIGRTDTTGGMPSGIMANLWGSTNWGYMNRLERGELKAPQHGKISTPSSPQFRPSGSPSKATQSPARRQTVNLDGDAVNIQSPGVLPPEFPNYYPLQLKAQDAQFRLLFPNVRRQEKLVLVFRASWNPNDQQEFPGRAYVTAKEIYFYSNHLGLVLITGVSLESISEVTAAPGRDCDFLFLHLKDTSNKYGFTRITIKTFLDPLKLLQRRLNFLVQNCNAEDPLDLESIMKTLIKLEHEDNGESPSLESWEDVSISTPADDGSSIRRDAPQRGGRDLRTTVLVDQRLYGATNRQGEPREVAKFKLPAQPVVYTPRGMHKPTVEKTYEISPKALFHVMFGDRSAVWQLLYHERRAQGIKQKPWSQLTQGHMRREFEYQIDHHGIFGRVKQITIADYQMIDVLNDHLCYVVTDRKIPWHLPYHQHFMLVTKVVITHTAKSKCKLAIYTKVEWSKPRTLAQSLVERRALADLEMDSLDLADLITDQVRKLGPKSRTKKAIEIFGHVGQQTQVSEFTNADVPLPSQLRRSMTRRTMARLIIDAIASLFESVLTSLLQWIGVLMRWVWKTANANSFIIGILALSVLTNLFFSSRDTSAWWKERNASKFMTRLGVGPNQMMSKAVYVSDLDGVVSNTVWNQSVAESRCMDAFQQVANLADMDAPYSSTDSVFSDPSTKATARRLRRTRQHLGSYRHDLLVAMRVVNRIEQEVRRAEWENWVLDETSKCSQIEAMMNEKQTNKASSKKQQVLEAKRKRFADVKTSYEGYCDSCRKEQASVRRGIS